MSFASKIKENIGEGVPDDRKFGEWNGVPYEHIFKDLSDNFIDGICQEKCSVKGDIKGYIKYHRGAKHMNSSQVMCINFFKKFFEKPEYEHILLDVLRQSGINIQPEESIEKAAFEYVPDKKEGTNFDFCIVLNCGRKITFEVKYTEAEFGRISYDKNDPDKYNRKWDKIYKEKISSGYYLKGLNIGKKEFYDNYQINRNILYAEENDYVLFLTPKENDADGILKGRDYIDGLNNPNVKNLYWKDIADLTMKAVENNRELCDYYSKFYDKYISILLKAKSLQMKSKSDSRNYDRKIKGGAPS